MRYRIWAIVLGLLTACRPQEPVDVPGLQAYVQNPENGLIQTQEVKGLRVSVSYRPADLLIAQELGTQASQDTMSAEKLGALRKKYDNLYFILTLSQEGREVLSPAKGFGDFSEMLQVLSFRMGEYVLLKTERDTLMLGDYLFERTYGMGSGNSMLFAFTKEALRPEAEWMEFQVNEFGMGTGNLRFRFRLKDIKNAPLVDWQTAGRPEKK
jgi:hypothetical protein